MLKTRVLTAIVLLAGFAVLVTATDAHGFSLVIALVTAVAAWEWGRLSLPTAPAWSGLYAALLLALCLLGLDAPERWSSAAIQFGAVVWCLSPLALRGWAGRGRIHPMFPLLGALVLIPACLSLAALRDGVHGGVDGYLLWAMLIIVWVADSGAYFVGRAFGRHRLAPRVSPGKTWEGFAGGVGAASLVGMLLLGRVETLSIAAAVGIAAATAAFSVLGDLFESLLKRLAGVKDSGAILPGHGGVLDRVDGILAAAPVFYVLTAMTGIHG